MISSSFSLLPFSNHLDSKDSRGGHEKQETTFLKNYIEFIKKISTHTIAV
ncbi:hypothetical protein SAMN05421766_10916 [Zobellia uliginosa]|uniref:Uncharacterized protein n=1 Tax=Zobellia uliginosa TaxID=143224 RepID=A0ABY1L1V4_9FLAO|nr:hypothetical protein SAMN05421766_10916 [Zobellia uliginosa]